MRTLRKGLLPVLLFAALAQPLRTHAAPPATRSTPSAPKDDRPVRLDLLQEWMCRNLDSQTGQLTEFGEWVKKIARSSTDNVRFSKYDYAFMEKYPLSAVRLSAIKDVAYAQTNEICKTTTGGRGREDGTEANAIVHFLLSAYATAAIGREQSVEFLVGHEVGLGTKKLSYMDLHNNSVGVEFAGKPGHQAKLRSCIEYMDLYLLNWKVLKGGSGDPRKALDQKARGMGIDATACPWVENQILALLNGGEFRFLRRAPEANACARPRLPLLAR